MTRLIVIINVLVFLFQFLISNAGNRALIYNYGFIPGNLTRAVLNGTFVLEDLIPLLTSMFLHGSWAHLLGNMWILWIFGDNVEDRLGHFRYLIFYTLSGAAAMASHLLFNAGSSVPAIGASGAIAGVMGAYIILFPYSKITTLVLIVVFPLFIKIPAVIYLALWFLLQVYSGTINSLVGGAGSGVAWWAHIGGFISGILLLKLLYTENMRKPVRYEDDYRYSYKYNNRYR